MSRRVLVVLAEGFEDVEAITPIDYLRRSGIEVVTAAVGASSQVKSSRGTVVIAEQRIQELAGRGALVASQWDGVVIPGGMPGSTNVAASREVQGFIKDMHHMGKVIAAICAAPAVVLAPLGVLHNRRFTCYPGMEKQVTGAQWSGERVVVDGNLITSRAAGTAGEWAIAIIEKLLGPTDARKVAEAVLLH